MKNIVKDRSIQLLFRHLKGIRETRERQPLSNSTVENISLAILEISDIIGQENGLKSRTYWVYKYNLYKLVYDLWLVFKRIFLA